MRIGAAMARVAALTVVMVVPFVTSACSRTEFFRQYEYEEELYLSLDGSATVYVNASVAALDALRGAPFDPSPGAEIDRDAVRTWFTSPVAPVTRRPTLSRRNSRRFVHVRLDIDDVTQLGNARPFSWSRYSFSHDGDDFVFHQTVGAPAGKAVSAAWTGGELVAFRVHLPSTILDQNAGPENYRRGNILVWEQTLSARLGGTPLVLDARIESQSILSRTLLLFAVTFLAVAAMFGLLIWWVLRRGKSSYNPAP